MLTDRQKEIVNFIVKCQGEGFTPSHTEIAEEFGFRVNASVDHLNAIEKKGAIEITRGKARRIKVLI